MQLSKFIVNLRQSDFSIAALPIADVQPEYFASTPGIQETKRVYIDIEKKKKEFNLVIM